MPISPPGELPALSPARLVVVREIERSAGFLTLRRLEMAVEYEQERSAPFVYDIVERKSHDAAAVAAHFVRDGKRWIVLRSSVRPPFSLVGESGVLWELPAGLIEPGEAPIEAAARELNEEIGTQLTAARLTPLGAAIIPVPAMIAERQYLFHVEIDPDELGPPAGDGSALERASVLAMIPVAEALAMVRDGRLPDGKTEIGLRRLVEVLK